MSLAIFSSARAARFVAAARFAAQVPPDIGGDFPSRVDGAVGQIANQHLLLPIAQTGHRQDCARIGCDDRPQVAIDRKPEARSNTSTRYP